MLRLSFSLPAALGDVRKGEDDTAPCCRERSADSRNVPKTPGRSYPGKFEALDSQSRRHVMTQQTGQRTGPAVRQGGFRAVVHELFEPGSGLGSKIALKRAVYFQDRSVRVDDKNAQRQVAKENTELFTGGGGCRL